MNGMGGVPGEFLLRARITSRSHAKFVYAHALASFSGVVPAEEVADEDDEEGNE